jgi:drug/metabolite transporter (DMT)-like permease
VQALPIVLILVSCFTHVTWNLLARHSRREVEFFRRMLIVCLPLSAVVMGVCLLTQPVFPRQAVLYAIGAGAVSGAYFLFLGLAYRSSDFTVVYPVARALPVLMLAGVDMLRGYSPSAMAWLAMGIVVVGCVLAPQKSLRGFTHRHYTSRTFLFIFLTAAAIAAFSTLDKLAAEMVGTGIVTAATQAGIFHTFSAVTYIGLGALFLPARSAEDTELPRMGWRGPVLAALIGYATYTLVLWAFQLTPKVSYLVAFRQFSIVLGVVTAFVLHKEEGARIRIPASLAIVAGLVLLALAG